MPGGASIFETPGQPQIDTDANFSACIIGYAVSNPVASGHLTTPYSSPGAAVADLTAGDAVDLLCQAITVTPGNPAPPPCSFYATPATTPGAYGTIVVSGVTGTSVPANNTAVAPKGTFDPWMQVVTGGTVGTTGMTAYASLNGGRQKTLVQLGTATTYNFPASDGWPTGNMAGFVFAPAAATVTALLTKITLLQTTLTGTGHFVLTTSTVHLAADTTDDTALAAVPAATTAATGVTLFNACKTYLAAHGASTTYHTIADAALATALAAIPTAVTIADVDLYLDDLIAAYNAHRVNTTGTVHGAADSTNTITAYVPIPGTLIAGDVFYTHTQAPQWAVADLYTAASGPTDASGAFAALAHSSQQFGRLYLTEPMAASDFSTVVAGLNYGLSLDRRWKLTARFRDPTSGETDAAYITAFQTFVAACLDSRIEYLAGSCYVSDATSGRVYERTFMAPYAARNASFRAMPGQEGETLAQNPGWVARGPLEGASLKDTSGNTIGHDESRRGGISAANGAPTGGGIGLCYRSNVQIAGTYVDNRVSVAYPVLSTVLTPMDRAVANALETLAVGISLAAIGGADLISDSAPRTLDEIIRLGLAAKIAKRILELYPHEIANADDPGLVVIDETVTVSGAQVAITGALNVKFWSYTDTVTLRFVARR